MIIQIIVISLMTFDFVMYLQLIVKPDHLVEFINNQQFNLQLLGPVSIHCFCTIYWFAKMAAVKLNCQQPDDMDRQPIFSLQALIGDLKLTLLNKNWHILKYGILFFIAPLTNMMLMGFEFRAAKSAIMLETDQWEQCVTFMILYRTGEISAMFFYGWFTFSIYINRKKYQYDFAETAAKLVNNNYDIDQCKSEITSKWFKFQEYRKVTGWWWCYTTTLGVLAGVSEIMWLSSSEYPDIAESKESILLNVVITCQCVMWLIQPLFAVGGFNVDNLWQEFLQECMKNFHNANNHLMLEQILDYMNKIYTRGPWVYTTVVFAGLSIFVAIAIPIQFVEIWIRPGCSIVITALNLTTSSPVNGEAT